MKPSLERQWEAFRRYYQPDEWMVFVEQADDEAERLRRFDWMMARHEAEDVALQQSEIVGDTVAFLNAHGDNQRMMDSMDLRWTPSKPSEAGTP